MEKKEDIRRNQLETSKNITDKMFQILQPCYYLLRGLDKAPANVIKEYKMLKRYLQGARGVTWSDDNENEPPSNGNRNTTVTMDENRAIKRKHNIETNSTEETFVMKTKPIKFMQTSECLSKGGLLKCYLIFIGEEALNGAIQIYTILSK